MADLLTVEDVRTFISDRGEFNHLLDGEEFSDMRIQFAMEMAKDTYNHMPPSTGYTLMTFPSKAVLLYGTLAALYHGAAALLARNHMSYSDGGITVPVEERYELYMSLANTYNTLFEEDARRLKLYQNIEAGWGGVGSDMGYFPIW